LWIFSCTPSWIFPCTLSWIFSCILRLKRKTNRCSVYKLKRI
jgi:hypothetical protein